MSVVILPFADVVHPALNPAGRVVSYDPALAESALRVTLVNLMDKPVGYDIKLIRLIAASVKAGDRPVLLRFVRPLGVVDAGDTADYRAAFYTDANLLDDLDPARDRFIVSGRVPYAENLSEEPYYSEVANMLDHLQAVRIASIVFCLAAHLGLQHFHGIARARLPRKLFGVYKQRVVRPDAPFVRGLGVDSFDMPVSRFYYSDERGIQAEDGGQALCILATSEQTGASIVQDGALTYITGHLEYDVNTLKLEYDRDCEGSAGCDLPVNYDVKTPVNTWDAASRHMVRNFLSDAMCEE